MRSGRSRESDNTERKITIKLPKEWVERDTRARIESVESTNKIIQAVQANTKPKKS